MIDTITDTEIIDLLGATRSVGNTWVARCPACERNGDLVITADFDKTASLHCRSNCSVASVARSVNALWNRINGTTATGTTTATGSIRPPAVGGGIAEPIPVLKGATTTGTTVDVHPVDSGGLIIDPEFRGLIRPLDVDEQQRLESSLLVEGCRDALLVWRGILVDGHNRHEICLRLGIPFRIQELSLPDDTREGAMAWAIDNQLARRNLHPDDASLLRGRAYRLIANAKGRPEKMGKSYPFTGRTSEQVATRYGVSEKTVRNDSDYFKAVETLTRLGVPRATVVGNPNAPRSRVIALAQQASTGDTSEQRRALAELTGIGGDSQPTPSVAMAGAPRASTPVRKKSETMMVPTDPELLAPVLIRRLGADGIAELFNAINACSPDNPGDTGADDS